MKKYLLDTHTFLWSLTGKNLSQQAQKTFLDRNNELFFSAASYWEICIKYSIGKLELASNWQEVFAEEMRINTIRWLPIEKEHCIKLLELPTIHQDPFDRLLISQALCTQMIILTADGIIPKYPVPTFW